MRPAVFLAFLAVVVTPFVRAERTAQFQFRYFYLRGDELRVILDSSLFVASPLSHGSSTQDVKGWLVCIDLASSKPLMERARLYGPLWDWAAPQSSLSHADGVVFTPRDQRAAAARGFIAFDHAGQVVRINGGAREILELSPKSARWRADGAYTSPQGQLPPMSEDDMQTLSHRYRLRRADAQVGSLRL